MNPELLYVTLSAITVSFLHTITGPDHYLPFIALSKTKNWSINRTISWTVICGLGHIAGSLLLGFAGIAFGWSISSLVSLEDVRGGIAAWCMFVAGILYLLYAFVQLHRNKLHKHFDVDKNEIYVYEHRHNTQVNPAQKQKVTPWVMFIIFLLGPCEPMIPLLSFPAANQSVAGIFTLVIVFTTITLITMVAMVSFGYYGFKFFKTDKLEKYVHVMGGATVMICGAGMLFMGW